MTVYLSGPVSNVAEYDFDVFDKTAWKLMKLGYTPINPLVIAREMRQSARWYGRIPGWSDFMREDLPALCGADAVLLLPGWRKSRGAKWERIIAKHILSIPVYESIEELKNAIDI